MVQCLVLSASVTFGVFVVPPPFINWSGWLCGSLSKHDTACAICCIVYTWRQIVLSDDFLVTLEHDVTRVVMTSHEY